VNEGFIYDFVYASAILFFFVDSNSMTRGYRVCSHYIALW